MANFLDKLKQEAKVITGEVAKDKVFSGEENYGSEAEADNAFARGREKLFNVNAWSNLDGVNSTFELFNPSGQPSEQKMAEGFYMKIILPGAPVENWVQAVEVKDTETVAQFTVHPCPNPHNDSPETQHFFVKEASSTFRLEKDGTTLRGFQIGQNEKINNHDYQAGNRAFLNTFIAEGGWAGFQKLQWEKLIQYWIRPD